VLEVVEAEDVVGCTLLVSPFSFPVEGFQRLLKPGEERRADKTHQIKCRPFGIVLTLLTAPLP
jgi:hypothetical protein